ncbi:hypothetical protein SPFL3102_03390 [Sporomusaceae bacterium FL31]|nr:hypothetical protein SPFL3101_03965 [Sporomusaceae bacterium FL31]GCE35539.1 hypothetical protein SPFL3102_03390 [Sporomusaceae bacterium]
MGVSTDNTDFTEADLNSLVLLAAVLAIIIGKGKTSDELNVIGNFLSTLGTALTVLGSTSKANDDQTPPTSKQVCGNDIQQQIDQLRIQIDQLNNKINNDDSYYPKK